MRIVRLSIRNFRGIRSLDWDPPGGVICLVGPGDSGKTTILDAIELALLPRAWTQLVDADFHSEADERVIEVEVTIIDAPQELLTHVRFGLEQRGWTQEGEIRDEPQDDDTPALTIRLLVDDSLDPAWHVTSDRNPEGRVIGVRDRAALAAARLGEGDRRQLSWVRGSSLARVTDSPDAIAAVLNQARRTAWEAISDLDFDDLVETASTAGGWGERYGAYAVLPLDVAIDLRNLNIGAGALTLRQGNGVPASALGTGSRRLLGLAIQRQVAGEPVVALVDEVEIGLEPHRLRHLLSQLRESDNQVLLVSHSPVAVAELGVDGLGLVRRDSEGNMSILHADSSLQGVIRAMPEAILSRRVVVCEGQTEYGIARGLVHYWDQLAESPLAATGTVIVAGNGSQAPERAMALRDLGYECVYWADSDVEVTPSLKDLEAAGVDTETWGQGKNTEQRIMADVSESLLEVLWDIAAEERGLEGVSAQLAIELHHAGRPHQSWDEWAAAYAVDALRSALGEAAAKRGWFKSVSTGERVGEAIASEVTSTPSTDLGDKLERLRHLAYRD